MKPECINTQEMEEIKAILQKHLDIDESEQCYLLSNIISMFDKSDKNFFLQMRYELLQKDDTEYSQKILLIIFDIFAKLCTGNKSEEYKNRIKISLEEFALHAFIQSQEDRSRIFQRREVVNSILHHMTSHLNDMLDTQKLTIANISHEMRTSLNAIIGYTTQLGISQNINGTDKEYLCKAKEASSTLLELVNEILDVTKISAGELDIKPSNFWIDDLLSEILNAATDLEERNKQISFLYDFDFFAYEVYGDRNRVYSVVSNLLNNAFKYTNSGTVRLSVKKEILENDNLKISFIVKDTGSGMSDKQLENIFKPFVRHNSSEQGVGLGLFIAQKLAINMSGSLEVKSRLGSGSEFVFTITLKQQIKEYSCLKESHLLFFIENKKQNQIKLYEKMKKNLVLKGSKITLVDNEDNFLHIMTDAKQNSHDIISITSSKENHKKYNALVAYLKQNSHFRNTLFITSFTRDSSDLDNFDQLFKVLPTMSSIIRRLTAKRMVIDTNMTMESAHSLKILAVDDIETNLEVLELFIKNRYKNAAVDKATGGYEAIGMCKVQTYDLILMDLKMPGMDGYDVLKKLKSQGNMSDVYALTADVYDETLQKVRRSGFLGLLEKPIQVDTLYGIIEQVRAKSHTISPTCANI